ncbi:MAG: TonB family protein [Saprospiraceae bacterium]
MKIKLIVVRTKDIELLANFYQKLGIQFQYHRHGKGPFHYSADLEGTIFEIYPLLKNQAQADHTLRLGLEVEKLDALIPTLEKANIKILKAPTFAEFGYFAIIQDLDGRKIELKEEEPEFVDGSLDEEEEVIAPPPAPVVKVPEKPTLPPPPVVEDNTPIMFAEQMPRFPGCVAGDKKAKDACSNKALLTFLSSKLNYPALARENGISGIAVIRFIVEKDGSLTNLEIVKDPGGGLGKEALRVVQLMNKMDENWTPGKQNARPVRVRFNLPVKFRLQ